MSVVRLATRLVEKPWGRHRLWPGFADAREGDMPIGEIWFQDERGFAPEILVKYLFTSEKLSVQVHPSDATARTMGYPRGKDEAWIVLAAEPNAVVGLGLRAAVDRDRLRAAALDGSIEAMLDWKPAKAGDFIYSPGGTIHAIGPGLTLIEIQQNIDLTFRFYDYGRPRELHLDEAVVAADPVPYVAAYIPRAIAPGRMLLADGPKLVIERWTGAQAATLPGDAPAWVVPVAGAGAIDGDPIAPGGVWLVEGVATIETGEDADLLIARPAAGVPGGA